MSAERCQAGEHGAPGRHRHRGHLLVVDGEQRVGHGLQQFLSRDHDVEIESRAAGVVSRIDGGAHFDVILCDVMMPDSTGPELCAKLAANHPDQAAGMVFMTDGEMSDSAREALAKTSNLCIRRPFDVDGVRALIWRRMALGRR
jgi:CheY-like chemotaxis protein